MRNDMLLWELSTIFSIIIHCNMKGFIYKNVLNEVVLKSCQRSVLNASTFQFIGACNEPSLTIDLTNSKFGKTMNEGSLFIF